MCLSCKCEIRGISKYETDRDHILVNEEDWILLDLIYPDRKGQILGLADNPGHRWIYRSKMTPLDIAYFNIFDNQGQPSIAHSAMDMIEDPTINTVRKSIESRTLVRYRDRHSDSIDKR